MPDVTLTFDPTLLMIGFIVLAGLIGREIIIHSKISKLCTDIQWLKQFIITNKCGVCRLDTEGKE